jgi:predicted ribosome quality control (RQC) complex YloA/Tae2 family protein
MKTETFNYNNTTYTIIIGKNKNENWAIIDDASVSDLWFHISEMPSCHVILKNNENLRVVPRQVIKHCAYLCKINSSAKTMSKCDVIYTPVCNVKKTSIVGQVTITQSKMVSV